MRDMGFYDHTVGLYFESKDGLNWQNPQIGWFGAEHYIKQPPAPKHLKRYGRFERLQVLMKMENRLTFSRLPKGEKQKHLQVSSLKSSPNKRT